LPEALDCGMKAYICGTGSLHSGVARLAQLLHRQGHCQGRPSASDLVLVAYA
jgi:hypothetical protein